MSVLNYAVKLKYIPNNPLKDTLEFTFNESKRSSTKKEMQFYTSEQLNALLKLPKTTVTRLKIGTTIFFCILFFMGLRKGECYGLTWNDIEGNTMHIRRSVSQKIKDADGNDYVDTPKNHKIRDILIPQQLLDILNAHKERQQNAAPDQFNNNFKICGYGNKSIRDSSVDNRNRL